MTKDKIKELKKEALEKFGEQENPEPWFSPQEVLNLIADFEFLETELKLYKIPDNILVKEYQKQQEKIEDLEMKIQATYDAIEEKALITITEIKQLKQDYKDLRAVAEEYRKVARPIIDFYAAETLGGELTEKEIEILNEFDEALAAKGK